MTGVSINRGMGRRGKININQQPSTNNYQPSTNNQQPSTINQQLSTNNQL
ncbi:MAG: hypothetical protein VKN72_03090 [Nostocales cyanobacterium 94392]|nr:hypothetical protein [Nostocales cyanobacterium 94392]